MPRSNHHRRGTILIIAMVVLFALAALVLTLGRSARTDALTAANAKAAAQADAVERGAEQYVLATLANNADTLNDLTDDDFANVPVGNGAFWIIRPTYNDANVSQYGLLDESAKLNLNSATTNQLILLPGMTDDLASAIVAWRDTGDTNASYAPSSSGLDGAVVKNSPYETVDEMLQLSGMTRELLYGASSTANTPNVNTDWYQQHGLADFFSAWSTRTITAPDGTPRFNLSEQAALPQLPAFLQNLGVSVTIPRNPRFRNIFDLAIQTGMTSDQLAKVEDYIMSNSPGTPPMVPVNVNTAPREVLIALGLSDANADALIAARQNAIANTPNSMAWVLDTLKADAIDLGDLITGRGRQYSAEIVAASGNGRAFRRVKIVIDTSASPARIVYRRDITDRGWPLDASILTSLRSGQGSVQRLDSGGLAQ